MRKVYCILILSLYGTFCVAQHVAIVNGKAIDNKEFMWFYKKNHAGNANVSYQDLLGYLNLYIDFKLKVLDAEALKMDKDTAYITEIKNYENTLNEQRRVSKRSPEFAFLMNEYKEAVLMFNVSEQKIWNIAQDELTQKTLELDWISELRKKYPVKIFQEQIRKMARP
ncbi:hypothetical protein ACXZ1K_00735 [Pedobacter sp. PWIIR3]